MTISSKWNEAPGAVTLIDAHHHLWDLKANRYPFLTDRPDPHFFLGSYEAIRRDYLPEDYLRDSSAHNVLTTVHCEAEMDRANQVGETRWLTEVNARHGFPGAIVAHAWFHTDNAEEILAAQAQFPLVRGIRSKPVTSLRPSASTPGAPGTMEDDKWLRGFALLEKYGLSWDLRVPSWHLAEAAGVARQFPRTPIVLNHTGFPWDRSEEGLVAWRRSMEAVAREPNVHVKVSEFGLKDSAWEYESNRRVVREAIAIFGIDRCIFASNFPVAGLRIDYDTVVRSLDRMLADRSQADRDRFFWKNAASFYRLSVDDIRALDSNRASSDSSAT
jgi:predicted TIM-barrel fold metal-dependent hydrolase